MVEVKLIAFDYDETLVSLGKAHYESLNLALATIDEKFKISHEEQVARFEGLTTKSKLNILVKERGFPKEKITEVFNLKQHLTATAIDNTICYNPSLVSTLSKLKQEGFLLFITSNAIRLTIESGLKKAGILEFFDKIISNEEVSLPKPHPQIYLKAMVEAGVAPNETLIVEDSKNGREAAAQSGAHLLCVDGPHETTYEAIKAAIDSVKKSSYPKWHAPQNVNVLIPMAGAGSRLRAKYNSPKPLINIHGKPMIQRVIESLGINAKYIFIVQKEHFINYNLGTYLNLIAPGCQIITTDGLTAGAACTSLLAKEYIDNDKHLLIANSDQLLDWNAPDFMYDMLQSKVDGGILTFEKHNDPKWSYVSLDENGFVNNVVEKKPISNHATIGLYYFNRGSEYVKAAEDMIAADDRVNSEYYIAPCYNYMIKNGAKIKIFNIDEKQFYPTGTIEDLENVLTNPKFTM